MTEARGTLLVAFCLRVGENGSSYLYQVFALSYLTKVLLVDKSVGTIGITVAAALAVFTIPLMGWLSDRFGRRLMYRLVALFTCLWAFPAFWLFSTKDPVLIVISMSVAIGVGVFGMYGIQGAYFPELFNARYQYTGIAVSKEFAAVASGGIAPFIATALLGWSGGAYWPIALYIAVLAGISFVATFFAPETRGISLDSSNVSDSSRFGTDRLVDLHAAGLSQATTACRLSGRGVPLRTLRPRHGQSLPTQDTGSFIR